MFERIIDVPEQNLRFHILNTDKFKMSRLSLSFVFDADARISPLVKLMMAVIMRGSEDYPEISDINRRLDELYGATVSYRATSVGGRHIFKISCDMLSNKYRLDGDEVDVTCGVVELILGILFAPLKNSEGLLSEKYSESEKKLAIDAIKARINDQKAYAADKCKKAMLSDHVSAISVDGSCELLSSFGISEITDIHRYFLENSVVEFYYVGSDDVSSANEMIKQAFSNVPRATKRINTEEMAFVQCRSEVNELNEELESVSQGRLNIGCACGTVMKDRDYHAMSMFNEMLGGTSVSKLFMNVREKKSLCYYCYSSYNSANGTIMIGCGIEPKNKKRAMAEIKRQIDAMKMGNFTDDELLCAKRAILSGLKQIYDSPHAVEAFKFRRLLAGVEESVDECAMSIESVSRDDVISAANKVKIDTVYFLSGKTISGENNYAGEESDYE